MYIFCLIIFLISFAASLLSEKQDHVAVWGIIAAISAVLTFVFGAFESFQMTNDEMNKEYPASEYTIQYKVTTIGEKSDTTYVLTKIKED